MLRNVWCKFYTGISVGVTATLTATLTAAYWTENFLSKLKTGDWIISDLKALVHLEADPQFKMSAIVDNTTMVLGNELTPPEGLPKLSSVPILSGSIVALEGIQITLILAALIMGVAAYKKIQQQESKIASQDSELAELKAAVEKLTSKGKKRRRSAKNDPGSLNIIKNSEASSPSTDTSRQGSDSSPSQPLLVSPPITYNTNGKESKYSPRINADASESAASAAPRTQGAQVTGQGSSSKSKRSTRPGFAGVLIDPSPRLTDSSSPRAGINNGSRRG